MLVLPKWYGVDKDTPKLESKQREVVAEKARLEGQADGVKRCECICCRAAPSPCAPGRHLCYSCLHAGCQPSQEHVCVGASYADVDQQRLAWEAAYPHWYLQLASEWTSEGRPTQDRPFGARHYWQRFLVRRR